ncbi:helix-turn-helix transcriptional regulator [Streptomyces viridosporus]|uniref:helix-turn-helix domain-containing protein n=1 Tax=Streptomyces viridosporus TaxID=67581 RepID=UPI0033282F61
MVSKQGRQEGSINPEDGPVAVFAIELRRLRERCGRPTYRELATLSAKVGTPYSDTTFSTAARGHAVPSRAVVMAYVRACLAYAKKDEQTNAQALEEWDERWTALQNQLAPERPETEPPADRPVSASRSTDQPQPEEVDSDQTVEHPEHRPVAAGPRRRMGNRAKRALMFVAGALVTAGLAFSARYASAPGSAAADRPPPAAAPSRAALPEKALPTADVGGNIRCARPRYINGLAWRPCMRVDHTKLVFVVQMSNEGPEPVTVRAKLAYIQAGKEAGCPGDWGAGVQVEVAPGETVTSPQTECTADKLPATPFQTKAWVTAPSEDSWGYREMSQTVHIQADGTTAIWADEA